MSPDLHAFARSGTITQSWKQGIQFSIFLLSEMCINNNLKFKNIKTFCILTFNEVFEFYPKIFIQNTKEKTSDFDVAFSIF